MNVRRPIVLAAGQGQEAADAEAVGLPHPCGLGAAPAVGGTGLAVGASAVATAGSTDAAGEVVLTTALVALAVGTTLTITFATPFTNRPFVQLSPASPLAVGLGWADTTATGFTITLLAGVAVSKTIKWHYQVVGQPNG